ncbi:MAG TPA: B12-binding domain-containing radical SAM protein [Proteobacteria bacterium]|nr:B12-binding domain-containing radical SAM protein [Pseudomonadota bacterium]
MRVFLTVPSYDLLRKAYGIKKSTVGGFEPPLGLAYLASVLRQAGHQVTIYDPLPTHGTDEACLEEVRRFQPDVIGISVISCLYPQAKRLAGVLKAAYPSVPLLIGGPHCFHEPEGPIDDCEHFDISVAGEAEDRILAILDSFSRPEALSRIDGICYRWDGKTIKTPPAKPPRNLDDIPFPARDLLGREAYSNLPYLRSHRKTAWMIASRGCPWRKCTFCYQSRMEMPTYRCRSVENVLDEIEQLIAREGVEEITFLDVCMVGNRGWVAKLCDEIVRRGLKFHWSCQTRIDSVTPELLKRMARAGCYNIYYGIESADQRLLDLMCKGFTIEQVRDAVRWTHEAGIEVVGSFILGLPTETPEEGRKAVQLAVELDLDYAVFHYFHPESGTKIMKDAYEHGQVLSVDDPDFARVNYLPEAYGSVEKVEDVVSYSYRKFYLRPSYIAKRLSRIRNLPNLARHVKGLAIALGRLQRGSSVSST